MPRSSSWHIRFGVLPVLSESAFIVGGVMASAYSRLGSGMAKQSGAPLLLKVSIVAVVWQLCLYYADLYEPRTMLDRQLTVIRIGRAMFVATLVLALFYYWFPDVALGRGIMLRMLVVLPVLAFVWRLLIDWNRRRHGMRERLLIVGTSQESQRLGQELHGCDTRALEVVGFVDRDPARIGTPLFNPAVVGWTGDLGTAIERVSAHRVALSAESTLDGMSLDELLRLRFAGITFAHLADVYEEYTGKLAIDALTPAALMSAAGFQQHSWQAASKRVGDISGSIVGMALAAPLMLIAAVLIRLTSRGPVFYRQQRVGQDGRLFTIHKLRSMRTDAERESGPVWASDNDDRVTPVGRVLRRTRFDEVPQLWNVLRGEMSLVGPRPERPELDRELADEIPLWMQRRLVKPGITGWAQVRYSYAASKLDARVKLQYDLFYIKHMSLALDFLIVLMTTKTILRGAGAR